MSIQRNSKQQIQPCLDHCFVDANRMLYEFHLSQNAKRPGTVHATYLVYGVKSGGNIRKGANEDVEMASSPPYAESVTEVVQSYALSLVAEENLKDALAGYEEVSSIHVYSVAPHATKVCYLKSVYATFDSHYHRI